jgi:hypothetical protein
MLRSVHYRRFERSFCPHIQVQVDQGGSNKTRLYLNFLGLLDTTDANNTILRNVTNIYQSLQLNIHKTLFLQISAY